METFYLATQTCCWASRCKQLQMQWKQSKSKQWCANHTSIKTPFPICNGDLKRKRCNWFLALCIADPHANWTDSILVRSHLHFIINESPIRQYDSTISNPFCYRCRTFNGPLNEVDNPVLFTLTGLEKFEITVGLQLEMTSSTLSKFFDSKKQSTLWFVWKSLGRFLSNNLFEWISWCLNNSTNNEQDLHPLGSLCTQCVSSRAKRLLKLSQLCN